MKNKIFITGAAGFIGYHLCKRLIGKDELVIGFDNLNSCQCKKAISRSFFRIPHN